MIQIQNSIIKENTTTQNYTEINFPDETNKISKKNSVIKIEKNPEQEKITIKKRKSV